MVAGNSRLVVKAAAARRRTRWRIREVLVQLYNALDGENWNNNANWLTELPIRQWHGVTNDASGRVTRLLLESNGLAGALPKELGSLSNLKRLELANNYLTGEIPRELGNLSDLETLLLGSNNPNTGGGNWGDTEGVGQPLQPEKTGTCHEQNSWGDTGRVGQPH